MTFEQFKGSGSRSSSPMISLRKSGSIGINNAALQEFFEDSEYVNVYFDEQNNRIGLETLEAEDQYSYTLSRSESGGSIAPTAFLSEYELTPEVTTQYRPAWNEDEELVVVNLDEPVGTYGSGKGES